MTDHGAKADPELLAMSNAEWLEDWDHHATHLALAADAQPSEPRFYLQHFYHPECGSRDVFDVHAGEEGLEGACRGCGRGAVDLALA